MGWSNDDVSYLVKQKAAGRTISEIAGTMGRTRGQVAGIWQRHRNRATDTFAAARTSSPAEPQPEPQPVEAALNAQVRQLRRKNANLVESVGNWDLLVQEFVAAAPTLLFPALPRLAAKGTKTEQEMVAVLSDAHAGSSWESDQVDGNSSYSFEQFCCNLWFFGQEIIRFAEDFRPQYGCHVLHVDCLGDIVQGVLRPEDEVTNDFEILPLVVQTTKILYQWLAALAPHFDRIEFIGLPGNHGRQTRKPEAKRFNETNYDTLVYMMLRELIDVATVNNRVQVIVPKSRIITIDRLGHRVRLMHGDTIHGGNGISSIPLYGISRDQLRAFRKELRKNGGKLSLIEMGHFHTPSLLEGCVMMNGALCPPDPWASDELGASSDPTQWVYLTGRDHCYSWTMPVSLKKADPYHGFCYDDQLLDTEIR